MQSFFDFAILQCLVPRQRDKIFLRHPLPFSSVGFEFKNEASEVEKTEVMTK